MVFDARDALTLAARGEAVLFVRTDTTADDVEALRVAVGVVTTRGGITGDAAIIARTLEKPCIASCSTMHVDYTSKTLTVRRGRIAAERDFSADDDLVIAVGARLTIDGASGELWLETQSLGDSADLE